MIDAGAILPSEQRMRFETGNSRFARRCARDDPRGRYGAIVGLQIARPGGLFAETARTELRSPTVAGRGDIFTRH